MDPYKVFIVEDDLIIGKVIRQHLIKNTDIEVEIFSDGQSFLNNLYKNPDMISLDYLLPDYTGMELLKKIKKYNANIPIIIVSAQQDIHTAVELVKMGAYDYVVKDKNMKSRLNSLVEKLKEHISLQRKISYLEEEIGKKYEFRKSIKGNSDAMLKVFQLIEKASNTNITVSVSGETGTGKELVAKAIHYNSNRKSHSFVAINVTAVPPELIESELFGHEKGSFTGAESRRIGKFEEANKGTLFLDEIGDMDLNMQTKLLRVLQESEVTRVGGNNRIKLDVRVIVATHKNLKQEVRKGNFREDLYYRLLGLPIELPPLRKRDNDAVLLARTFLQDFCAANNMGAKALTPAAIDKIKRYPFPGNVRELKALIELAAVMSNDDKIKAEDISFNSALTIDDILTEECSLNEYNLLILKHFMKKYDNDIKIVAKKLEIGKTTVYRMLKKDAVEHPNS